MAYELFRQHLISWREWSPHQWVITVLTEWTACYSNPLYFQIRSPDTLPPSYPHLTIESMLTKIIRCIHILRIEKARNKFFEAPHLCSLWPCIKHELGCFCGCVVGSCKVKHRPPACVRLVAYRSRNIREPCGGDDDDDEMMMMVCDDDGAGKIMEVNLIKKYIDVHTSG